MARFSAWLIVAALLKIAAAADGYGYGGSQGSTTPSTAGAGTQAAATKPTKAAQSQQGGGTAGGASAQLAAEEMASADDINDRIDRWLFVVLAAIVAALLIYRLVLMLVRYVRTLTCLNNNTQRYFAKPNEVFGIVKEHILNAPLFRTRHNREFRLSAALNVGTLPTRFQALFLASYLGVNVTFCVVSIHWSASKKEVLSEFRNRTGVLAVTNLIPLFIMAGRNNPLIKMLGISFDTFNLMHRFFGRIVVVEILCHTFAWVISKAESSGEASVWPAIKNSPMMLAGFISTIAAVAILLQTPSIIRHAFYETFLHLHIALIILVIVTLWMHLDLAQLPQLDMLKAVIAIWVIERTIRFVKIIFRNVGRKGTKAIVEVLPGDAVRVTLDISRPWTFRPGQHIFLYMPSVGFWTSHPFSLAWSEEAENLSSEKGLAMNRQEVLEMRKTTMSLVCRRRTGFTDKLYKKAERAPDGKFMARAFVEGPYGGIHNLHSYGSVVLVAGGVGVTHHVPQVRDLVAGFANGTVAARRVVLVWVVQSPEHLEFIRPWMTTILGMEKRREILKILLFITRPRSTKEIHSPSATVQMFPGKPNFDTLLDLELDNQVGAMAVSVCGPGSLSDDVRKAVRRRQSLANIDFIEESFSW